MFCWRITKYDPKNRNELGYYLKDEWTEYGDIGRSFDGKIFTYEEYVIVEDAYIQAVLLFMDCLEIDSLKVISLEDTHGKNPESISVESIKIKNNEYYKKEMIIFIIKSILRYKLWCKLESENMRVDFGYDYYMGLACSKLCMSTIKKIENELGLFVEKIGCEIIFDDDEDDD